MALIRYYTTLRGKLFLSFEKQASQIKIKYRVSILWQEAATIIYMFSNSIVDHEYLYANNICILKDEKSSRLSADIKINCEWDGSDEAFTNGFYFFVKAAVCILAVIRIPV